MKPKFSATATLLVLLILFSIFSAPAQNIPALLKADGFDLKASGDVYGAIDKFELYCKKKPKDAEMSFFLATLLEETRDYLSAEKYYQKAYSLDPEKYPLAKFNAARMLKMSGAYGTALKEFENFNENSRSLDKELRKRLEIEILGCQQVDSLRDNPLKIEIAHLDSSVNKVYSEFSPWPINDSTLLYASFRTDSFIKSGITLANKRFYLATLSGNKWTGGQVFEGPFNTSRQITGNGCFSSDGERFYFSRCQKSLEGELICNLYLSRKTGLGWAKPKKMNSDINLPGYSSSQPAIGSDPKNKTKEIIYFVSNRPEGKGGTDIWYTVFNLKKNEFSEVRNAGNNINTSGNEMSPFFNYANSALYFSSDGLASIGGLDIFKATGSKRHWTKPKNMGYPINSCADDLYFTVVRDKKEGFFVSNRKGSISYKDFNCCDDIYSYKWKEYTAMTVMGSIGSFLNSDENQFQPSFLNTHSQDEKISQMQALEANLIDSTTGLINLAPDTASFYSFLDKTDPRLTWEDSLTLIHKLSTIDELIQHNDSIGLKKELRKMRELGVNLANSEWEEYLDSRKSEYQKIHKMIETGKIDEKTAYVKVRDKVHKIDYRQTYISLYLLDPIDKTPVLLKNDSVWPDGKFNLEVEPGNDYLMIAESPNFLRKSFRFSTHDMHWADSLAFDIQLDPITDKPIVLENIHFGFNSAELSDQVKAYLDSTLLIVLLDNPEIKIEVSAHTDSKGADEYNKKLSQKRANSVVAYLQSKGIDPKALVSVGYGEEKPIAPNQHPDGSDNPEGRQKNRRVEFRILL